jgi:hypothetical protein
MVANECKDETLNSLGVDWYKIERGEGERMFKISFYSGAKTLLGQMIFESPNCEELEDVYV